MLAVSAVVQRGAFRLDAAFELPTPGVVALFGRSGCGKSSLINVIAGLLEPDAGRVSLDDVVLLDTDRGVHVPPQRRGMGYVFQEARLFPHLDVAGNLRYAEKRAARSAYVDRDTVIELLDLGSLLQRRVHELSGGERQRVAIGRALLSQPRLLLLDEPLASLDGARRQEVMPYLESLRDRLAIPMVYVTHHFDEVLRLATHLVLMQGGAVIAQGELAAMSLHPQLRRLVGPDEIGAIVEGTLLGLDPASTLGRVRVGHGELHVRTHPLAAGTPLRVQLLARDIIVATQAPQHLSVRNSLAGRVTDIQADEADSDLITIDVGVPIMARITHAATRELGLTRGTRVWALIKSVSLRGHSSPAVTSAASPRA